MPPRPSLLILSFSPIQADARVLRQVRLFTDRYDVTTCGYGPPPEGVANHMEIPQELVHWHKDRGLLLQRRYAGVYRQNKVVDYLLHRLPRKQFDVVLANDIDTLPLALSLRPRGGVHADLHEYAPRENEESWRWRVFVAPYYRWLCRTFLPLAGSVTTVADGLAAQYKRDFRVAASVVVNAPRFADLKPTPTSEPLRLVHSGNARRDRRLELMFDAVEATVRPVTLDLFLVPNDPTYLVELKQRATKLSGVTIHDPVAPEDLPTILNDYDVGVFVLPPVTFNYLWALPNKFFDFIQARLGLVVGPSPEMALIVRRRELGVVTESFSGPALARALDELDPAAVARWKSAAHVAARDYSAERQTRGWADAVDALAGRAIRGAALTR